MRSAFTDGWWVWGCEVRLCDPSARVSRVCPGCHRCFFLVVLRATPNYGTKTFLDDERGLPLCLLLLVKEVRVALG